MTRIPRWIGEFVEDSIPEKRQRVKGSYASFEGDEFARVSFAYRFPTAVLFFRGVSGRITNLLEARAPPSLSMLLR